MTFKIDFKKFGPKFIITKFQKTKVKLLTQETTKGTLLWEFTCEAKTNPLKLNK